MAVGLGACTTITSINTSLVTYTSYQFSFAEFQNSSLAILPVITHLTKYEGFKRPAGEAIAQSILIRHKNMTIVPPQVTLGAINDAGLSGKYSNMMLSYAQTSILDQETITQICDATNVRFLLYTKLGAEETVETDYDRSMGVTKTKVTDFEIYAQLWDRASGDIVWEGKGGAAHLSNMTTLPELVTLAAENLAEQIGRTAAETPSPQDTSVLHSQAKSNQVAAYLGASLIVVLILYAIYPPPMLR